MDPLVMIVGGVALIVLLGVAGYFVLGREEKTSAPKPGLDAAWDHYVANPGKWSTRDQRAIASLSEVGSPATDKLRQSLEQTIEQALAGSTPLVALRQAIMDATDRFMTEEMLRENSDVESGPDVQLIQGVVETGVLRCFTMLRFDDWARDDWYSHYLKVAEMNSKNVAGMIRNTVQGQQASIETSLHDPLVGTMRQVRKALLHHPPKTPVQRSDKLVGHEVPRRPYPSQQQVDRLTGIMSDRFEKLFSGQIYQLGDSPVVDRAGAFRVDAGLLYTLLAVNFRHPTDGWHQIMDRALGPYSDARSGACARGVSGGRGERWTPNVGQFGGVAKVFSGSFLHAAVWFFRETGRSPAL